MSSARGALAPFDIAGMLASAQEGRPKGLLEAMPEPGLRGLLGQMINDAANAAGLPGNRMRNDATAIMDFLPGVGEAVGVDDARRSFNAGNYGQAALDAGTTALGAIPGGGDLAAGVAKAIFGGIGAKTADKGMLDLATAMAERGSPRDAIWNETGWFKGPDDQWRFEIDDSSAQFRGLNPEPQQTPIRAALQHPELYTSYPDMIPITVREETMGRGTHGRLSGDEIGVSWSAPDKRSTILHELQHAAQAREGFARGGSADSIIGNSDPSIRREFNSSVERLLAPIPKEKYISMVGQGWPEATKAQLDASYKQYIRDNKKAHGNIYHPATKAAMETATQHVYGRLAGEVEARNVQKRMNMTAAERRATPPWATQDVPDELQIVRRR